MCKCGKLVHFLRKKTDYLKKGSLKYSVIGQYEGSRKQDLLLFI